MTTLDEQFSTQSKQLNIGNIQQLKFKLRKIDDKIYKNFNVINCYSIGLFRSS